MPILSQDSLNNGVSLQNTATDFVPLDQLDKHADRRDLMVECDNDVDVNRLQQYLPQIMLIVLHVPHFSDGRAFSQAQRLRHLGFRGTVRVSGHLIPDQWPHAVRCGVDEVDISQELLHRTTLQAWINSAVWQGYQQRLKQRVSA